MDRENGQDKEQSKAGDGTAESDTLGLSRSVALRRLVSLSGWLSWDPSLAVSSDSAPFIHSVLIVVHILRKKERKIKYSYGVYHSPPEIVHKSYAVIQCSA